MGEKEGGLRRGKGRKGKREGKEEDKGAEPSRCSKRSDTSV